MSGGTHALLAALPILVILVLMLGRGWSAARAGTVGVAVALAVAPDPQILALLVAWFFVLFMEGAAGFGSSVAEAAPFLVAAGFRPMAAVTVTLVGHVVGVSFGAIGTPIVPCWACRGSARRWGT